MAFETRHGMCDTKIYKAWKNMLGRCRDTSNKNYGGRGISFDLRWAIFENFLSDMSSGFEDSLTLDRIDVNKGYSKENCRWVGYTVQLHNQRKRGGSSLPKGVRVRGNCIQARVTYKGEEICLGTFSTIDEAKEAYEKFWENKVD